MTSANSLYTWDQTIESVTVSIAVPSGTRGRDIAVDMSGSRLRAGLRGEPPMVDGELYGRIKTADSLWQLEGGVVEITMEKVDLQFWQTLMAVNPDVSASESGLDPRALFEAAYVAETKQSWAKALDFYQASADAGFAPAQLKLATMFEHGKETTGFDIEQDYAKAIELYTKAGEQGSPHAQLHLGQAYEDGKLGLPKNLAKAVEWYVSPAAAADRTRSPSAHPLRCCCLLPDDYTISSIGLLIHDRKQLRFMTGLQAAAADEHRSRRHRR